MKETSRKDFISNLLIIIFGIIIFIIGIDKIFVRICLNMAEGGTTLYELWNLAEEHKIEITIIKVTTYLIPIIIVTTNMIKCILNRFFRVTDIIKLISIIIIMFVGNKYVDIILSGIIISLSIKEIKELDSREIFLWDNEKIYVAIVTVILMIQLVAEIMYQQAFLDLI